jgi:hypothetical protein
MESRLLSDVGQTWLEFKSRIIARPTRKAPVSALSDSHNSKCHHKRKPTNVETLANATEASDKNKALLLGLRQEVDDDIRVRPARVHSGLPTAGSTWLLSTVLQTLAVRCRNEQGSSGHSSTAVAPLKPRKLNFQRRSKKQQ